MTSQATVRFVDGESRVFPVEEGQNVLAAAKAAGNRLVSQCEVGTCSTCLANLLSGDASMPGGRPTVLTQHEVELGVRLLCQTHVTGDAEFEVEYPSSLLDANPTRLFRTKIANINWVAESVVELELRMPKSFRFGFTAGQYCRIRVPGTDEWRSFSMASGEHEKNRAVFLIRILPNGVMSDFLKTTARRGDILELEGPKGGFVLSPDPRPHILMAGGTGLAPMLSMMSRLRYVRPTPPDLLLLFGCTNKEQLFYVQELKDRSQFLPTLEVRTLLTDSSGTEFEEGNPVLALQPEDIKPNTVAYLCGPPAMLHAAEEKLLKYGLSRNDIRMEQFLDSSN